ncbi:protein of unknown function [Nitrospira defluvii]|uniref:Uncharacterized protein n=1 Tax=Nitrospira defluvii TaxID=330214 RepID=D8PB42_9BACT|nr:protein of unknown function [Nitrospira defluvii]
MHLFKMESSEALYAPTQYAAAIYKFNFFGSFHRASAPTSEARSAWVQVDC